MERYRIARSAKHAAFFLLLVNVPLHAESTRVPLNLNPPVADEKIEPIEISLPTSTNPLPAPIDARGKQIVTKSFPPLAPLTVGNFPAAPALREPTPSPKNTIDESAALDLLSPTTAAAGAEVTKEKTATITDVVKAAATAAANATNSFAAKAATPESIAAPVTVKAPAPVALPLLLPAAAQAAQPIDTEKPMLPPAAEAAVILSRNQFYPQRVHVPQGTRVRIWFTTVEAKPAALIVEGLKMQRWIASENSQNTGNSSGYFELQRELTRDRVTEITLQPSAGTYPFFDALSGARGEIVVE